MGQISYIGKFDSAEHLDKIMYSYPGWRRGTVMNDQRSLTVLLTMLTQDELAVTEHTYPYDVNIYDDSEMVAIYFSLARKSRWKQFERTAIGVVRLNALRQMRNEGPPDYDDYISYRNDQIGVHCGNIEPTTLLMNLVRHPELKQFCIFTHPDRAKTGTAKYYCFNFSKDAHDTALRYQQNIFDYILKKTEHYNSVIPLKRLVNNFLIKFTDYSHLRQKQSREPVVRFSAKICSCYLGTLPYLQFFYIIEGKPRNFSYIFQSVFPCSQHSQYH